MTLFLSSDAFKGVKKAQQKCSFNAKSVVTNNNKWNAAKTKNTLKNNFFDPNKNININCSFSRGVMSLHLSKFRFLGGNFNFW